MPRRLDKACRVMGCPNMAPCPVHGWAAMAAAKDKRRGSAHSRGYGERWRGYTNWYWGELYRLRVPRAGLCGSRLPQAPKTDDSVCARDRRQTLATLVDHIVPVHGPDDPRFYDPANHQALCDACHNAKRQRESFRGRR